MKRNIVFGLMGVMALILMAGCNNATTPSDPSYVGTWKASDSTFSYTLVLTTSTFSYTDKAGSSDAQGPYSGTLSVSGSTMTFTQTSGGTATESTAFSVSGSTLHIATGTYQGISSGDYTKS